MGTGVNSTSSSELRARLLTDLAEARGTLPEIARRHGIPFLNAVELLSGPDAQAEIARIQSALCTATRLAATAVLPQAIAPLRHIISNYQALSGPVDAFTLRRQSVILRGTYLALRLANFRGYSGAIDSRTYRAGSGSTSRPPAFNLNGSDGDGFDGFDDEDVDGDDSGVTERDQSRSVPMTRMNQSLSDAHPSAPPTAADSPDNSDDSELDDELDADEYQNDDLEVDEYEDDLDAAAGHHRALQAAPDRSSSFREAFIALTAAPPQPAPQTRPPPQARPPSAPGAIAHPHRTGAMGHPPPQSHHPAHARQPANGQGRSPPADDG